MRPRRCSSAPFQVPAHTQTARPHRRRRTRSLLLLLLRRQATAPLGASAPAERAKVSALPCARAREEAAFAVESTDRETSIRTYVVGHG